MAGDLAGDGPERLTLHDAVDADGFRTIGPATPGRFIDSFGAIRVRAEGAIARCRVETARPQSNISDNVHGGFLMAFVDQALFCGLLAIDGLPPSGAVTVQAGVTFIAAATAGLPVDALVERVGETGRMIFVRGMLEQAGATIGSFEATLRKIRGAAA